MSVRDRLAAAWYALLDRPWSPEQVRDMAHRIGMHRGTDFDCPQCVAEQFAHYLAICDKILMALDLFDHVIRFRGHMREWADLIDDPGFLLHEHPAYAIADYLQIDPDSPAFGPLIAAAGGIMAEPR
jgi:hypothetical protein